MRRLRGAGCTALILCALAAAAPAVLACTRILSNDPDSPVLTGRTMDWPTSTDPVLTTAPNVIWADLKRFDLQAGAPVLTLNPDAIDLSGDVSARFRKSAAPY